jgi:hypothetical protein
MSMKVCMVIDAVIPALLYGGTQRIVVWLGRALHESGHHVTYLARAGSSCEFAPVLTLDRARSIDAQVPRDTDIVHVHSGGALPARFPACMTVYTNARTPQELPANTIFLSRRHAEIHNAEAFVHVGVHPEEFGPVEMFQPGKAFIFLGKAAWNVKNVRGAIRVARAAGAPIDVLGGTRLNFNMGFRLTLDPNARFHGMVGGENKKRFLHQARGLIHPVLWDEPGAAAVVESLYFGVPVFGTPYGCLPEQVPAHVGHLSAHEGELAEAAARAEQYDRHAIHAWWQEHFSAARMARKYLTYYEKILTGETLHPGPIHAPVTRHTELYPWHR